MTHEHDLSVFCVRLRHGKPNFIFLLMPISSGDTVVRHNVTICLQVGICILLPCQVICNSFLHACSTKLFKESRSQSFVHPSDAKYTNETLVRNGYLGASPDQPTLAFNFNVFEVYRQLHRVCPHLGIDGFTRALNHLHKVMCVFIKQHGCLFTKF